MNPYFKSQVAASSQGQLIIMLYDGVIRSVDAALEAFQEKDPIVRITGIHENLMRSQKILDELSSSLDMDQGGALAIQLRDLYAYFLVVVAQANIRKDNSGLSPLVEMLRELREGWVQAVRKEESLSAELASNAA